ncbi:hypothetical protein, partial [Xenorhabdus szentirmaii]|uniref:hypothetical protein n=1 Tax=Xenorhabdus szentirmaii TaxID=290112 RepID=UPI002B40EBE9
AGTRLTSRPQGLRLFSDVNEESVNLFTVAPHRDAVSREQCCVFFELCWHCQQSLFFIQYWP